jgi:hypothetical protein
MCITPLTGGVPGAESDGGGVADEPIPVAVHLADTLGNTQTYTGASVTHWVELRSVLQLEGPAPAATPTLLRRAEDGGWVGQLQLGAGLGTHEVTAVLCRCAGGAPRCREPVQLPVAEVLVCAPLYMRERWRVELEQQQRVSHTRHEGALSTAVHRAPLRGK